MELSHRKVKEGRIKNSDFKDRTEEKLCIFKIFLTVIFKYFLSVIFKYFLTVIFF